MKYKMTVTLYFATLDDNLEVGINTLSKMREEMPDSFIVNYFINDYNSAVDIESLEEV